MEFLFLNVLLTSNPKPKDISVFWPDDTVHINAQNNGLLHVPTTGEHWTSCFLSTSTRQHLFMKKI